MNIVAVHSNIKETILKQIKEAKIIIYVSVAWFTDKDLFDALVEKAKEGLVVEIVIHNDFGKTSTYGNEESINFSNHTKIDFFDLCGVGGKVYLLHDNHNKFCIIDLSISISGSYNWTYGANSKDDGLESIDIYSNDHIHGIKKAIEFKRLVRSSATLEEVIPSPYRIDVRSIHNVIKSAKQIERGLYKAITDDNAVFYVSTQAVDNGCFYEKDGLVYISDEFDPVQMQEMIWLVKRNKQINAETNKRTNLPAANEISDPVDDLPF